MVLWSQLFGRKNDASPVAAKAVLRPSGSPAGALSSASHVSPIASAQMSGSTGGKSAESDTGPWFIGKTVGEMFQIRGVLGRGGMGIVYLAYDTATQKNIAIKVPLGKFVDDADARRRFTKEAEAWTSLAHPHIVHAFDVKDDQSTDYCPAIFMDYCDGGNLAQRICSGTSLSLMDALDIVRQICWAMEYSQGLDLGAQRKGLVHRDLKPSNVLLTLDGRALVTDFGLVKLLDADDPRMPQDQNSPAAIELLTSLSLAGGTPEYMPPEQSQGVVSKQSDIYSFGILLYEVFCGQRPFRADDRQALREVHEKVKAPDPLLLNGLIPPDLAELMLACVSKVPEARGNFSEIGQRLESIYRRTAGLASPLRWGLACLRQNLGQKAQTSERRRIWIKPTSQGVTREKKRKRVQALLRLAAGCKRRVDLPEAERQYRTSLRLSAKLRDSRALQASVTGLQAVLDQEAAIERGKNDLDGAMSLHKEAESLCRKYGNKYALQLSLLDMMLTLKAQGQTKVAMARLDEAEALGRKLDNKELLPRILCEKGSILKELRDLEGSMEKLKEAMLLCCESGSKELLSRILNELGSVMDRPGDLDSAMTCLKEAEATCSQVEKAEVRKKIYLSQVWVLRKLGARERHSSKGLAYLKEEENLRRRELSDDKEGLQDSLSAQADNLRLLVELDKLTNPRKAVAWLKEQERVYRELDSKLELQTNLRTQLAMLGGLDEALILLQEQERVCRESDDKAGLQALLAQTSVIRKQVELQRRSDPTVRLVWLRQEERLCRDLDCNMLRENLHCQVSVLANLGDLGGALALLKELERICRESGDTNGLVQNLRSQASLLRRRAELDGQNDLMNALAWLKEGEQMCRDVAEQEELRANLLSQASMMRKAAMRDRQRDRDKSLAWLKEEERLRQQTGDQEGLRTNLRAQRWLLKRAGDSEGELALHQNLGHQASLLSDRGDSNGALVLLQEQERWCRDSCDMHSLRINLHSQLLILGKLADLLWKGGEPQRAVGLLKNQEVLCRELDDRDELCANLGKQATILSDRSDCDGAMGLLKEQERLCQESNDMAGVQAILRKQRAIIEQAKLEKAALEEQNRQRARLVRQKDEERLWRQLGWNVGRIE